MTGKAYEGKKVSRKQLVESSSSEQSQHSESAESDFDDALNANAKIYDDLKDTNEIDADKELDIVLKSLKHQLSNPKKPSQDEGDKSKAVQTQKKLIDTFLHQRILMQKMLVNGNKMP